MTAEEARRESEINQLTTHQVIERIKFEASQGRVQLPFFEAPPSQETQLELMRLGYKISMGKHPTGQ